MPEFVSCASCEIEVVWSPVERMGLAFCCSGCAAGGPCCCSYDEPRSSDVITRVVGTDRNGHRAGRATAGESSGD